MKSVLSLALVSLGLGAGFVAGCGDAGPKGDEEDPLGEAELDDKADSLRSPTNHGEIPFGDEQSASISGSKGFHAWTFTLHGDADVQLFTSSAGSGNVDTVLYLYKKKSATSWGSYIARNDDDGASVFSMLDKHLTAGEYRAIVKGHSAATRLVQSPPARVASAIAQLYGRSQQTRQIARRRCRHRLCNPSQRARRLHRAQRVDRCELA